MNRLTSLETVTLELLTLLEGGTAAEERDEKIENIDNLLSRREQLLAENLPPFNPAEMETGRRLLVFDEEIRQNLGRLSATVKSDLQMVKQKRKSTGKYINPYQATAGSDGMFLDHKK